MAIRNIRIVGDETLRKKSKEVKCVDEKILMLLDDMADTMYNTGNGAGLAAPQVGILKRLVVIDMGEGLIKLINPRIVESSGRQEVTEGCLSVPGKWGRLKRPAKVKVEALNEKNEKFTIVGTGDLAKCLCHEIDHLEGILFIDKAIEVVSE
ncbi:peptide deformylase [Vallitalea sp.]|jgi:peptide deformylase|uniref:peptide deformylase n=1 Tax=Vallitalea sp. TaxID=1882829 RepID=UPI0025FC5000|nr:peptide deformylase [Vallitalea sp.]MCT4687033.1 peptide deformylase [Vallitalea sp.]